MFFVLSKLLLFLLSPVYWIVLFAVVAYFTKRQGLKKTFSILALVTFIIFSSPILIDQFARWWDVPRTVLPEDKTFSCAILLGGFSSEDYNGDEYFNGTSDRFIQAVKLKSNGTVSHVLVTGGSSKLLPTDFREGDWVAMQLAEFKFADTSIIKENRSRNSFENAVYSKQILDSLQLPPPYILVTSAFHMRRALFIYRRMGVDVIPYPANYFAGMSRLEIKDILPNLGVLGTWEMYLKELAGYAVYYITKR